MISVDLVTCPMESSGCGNGSTSTGESTSSSSPGVPSGIDGQNTKELNDIHNAEQGTHQVLIIKLGSVLLRVKIGQNFWATIYNKKSNTTLFFRTSGR